jgi:hypothetical protein
MENPHYCPSGYGQLRIISLYLVGKTVGEVSFECDKECGTSIETSGKYA